MTEFFKKLTAFALAAAFILMCGCSFNRAEASQSGAVSAIINNMDSSFTQQYIEKSEYRAVWISYLEWMNTDMSSEQAFSAAVNQMFDNAVNTGLNTVIVQVRPFGDAMYKSGIFPYSHLLTGTQGQDPGYDPLEIMVGAAHERGLKIEAWINPYRVRLTAKLPAQLAENNPAQIYTQSAETARYVLSANGGLYYNPAIPQVRSLITDGVAEIVQNYAVDGIIFDDYFYPEGIDDSFDSEEYSAFAADGINLYDWRRENVNALMRGVYQKIKECNPLVTFSVSPQGNNDNNYNVQYSDIGLWLSQGGYADAVIPQIYWGYNFVLSSQSERFSFENCVNEWAAMPRNENVKLYAALGAFRIGAGDGSAKETNEWQSGANLSQMVKTLRTAGFDGFSAYRYDNLYKNTDYPQLAQSETDALAALLAQ